MLEIAGRQFHILLSFRQLTKLHLPYSNINSDDLIQIIREIKGIEDLDVTGCFNLCAIGYRQLKSISKLKFLSVCFLPILYDDLASLVNLRFLGLSKFMVFRLDLLNLILTLNNLKQLVILSTISLSLINVNVKNYFGKGLESFAREFKLLRRNITIYFDDFSGEYWEDLGSVVGVDLYHMSGFTECPKWYTEEAAYGLWLAMNNDIIEVIKNQYG